MVKCGLPDRAGGQEQIHVQFTCSTGKAENFLSFPRQLALLLDDLVSQWLDYKTARGVHVAAPFAHLSARDRSKAGAVRTRGIPSSVALVFPEPLA